MISPNIVIRAVDKTKPTRPDVRSPIKIAKAEFTVTLPNKMVHNNKLPLLLRGKMAWAYLASFSSSIVVNGPFVKSSRFFTSNPRRPRLRPEKVPDKHNSITIHAYYQAGIGPFGTSSSSLHYKSCPMLSFVLIVIKLFSL